MSYTGAHPDFDYFDTLDDNERLLREWHGGAGGRVDVWVGVPVFGAGPYANLHHNLVATHAAAPAALSRKPVP